MSRRSRFVFERATFSFVVKPTSCEMSGDLRPPAPADAVGQGTPDG